MMKQIPNIFTLLSLVFGCLAVMYALQPGLVPQYTVTDGGVAPYLNENTGVQYVNIPEKIQLASVFIGLAALVDFLDGFLARLLKAQSEMGKQLDSLSDLVSFGVAPGMVLLQLLRLAYAQQPDGLDINIIWLLPAFLLPAAGAYRLARFNTDPSQSKTFKGVPIPAAGLLIASFPLIAFFGMGTAFEPLRIAFVHLLSNKWFLYAVIFIVSYLMVCQLPMAALKFANFSVKDNWPKFLLVAICLAGAVILQWLAVPLVFVIYVILSLLIKQKTHDV
jgi:CDP-diacylglycerol--serine O-phosphatidyltransferase